MASLHQLQATIARAVAGVTQAVVVDGARITVQTAVGWPSIQSLREVASREKRLSRISV